VKVTFDNLEKVGWGKTCLTTPVVTGIVCVPVLTPNSSNPSKVNEVVPNTVAPTDNPFTYKLIKSNGEVPAAISISVTAVPVSCVATFGFDGKSN